MSDPLPPLSLEYGLKAPPLSYQIERLGLRCVMDIAIFQKDADAITRLLCMGVMTANEATKARHRLLKIIRRECRYGLRPGGTSTARAQAAAAS